MAQTYKGDSPPHRIKRAKTPSSANTPRQSNIPVIQAQAQQQAAGAAPPAVAAPPPPLPAHGPSGSTGLPGPPGPPAAAAAAAAALIDIKYFDPSFARGAFDTWITCGKCATTFGLLNLAITSFDSALKYDPSNNVALVGLASSLRTSDLNRNQAAGSQKSVELLTTSVQQFPELGNDSNIWKEIAECHLITGTPEQAHNALQRALQLEPNDASLWLLNGQSLVRGGAVSHAVDSLKRCLSCLSPDQESFTKEDIDIARAAHAELAAIFAADGNIEMASNELSATLALPPPPFGRVDEHAALFCALATARERAGDIVGALAACDGAHRAIGDNPRVLITHAYLLLLRESPYFNPSHAIMLLEKVVSFEGKSGPCIPESNSDDFLPWYLLGYAYTLVDSFRSAYDAYQIALRRAPSYPLPWLAVGSLYLNLGQLADALSAYSQAARLQINENNSPVSVSSSAASAAAWEGLADVYERCDDQANDSADSCLRAASCYRAAGDIASARKAEERAEILKRVAKGEISAPSFNEPPEIPQVLLRDLVPLSQSERVEILKETTIEKVALDNNAASQQAQQQLQHQQEQQVASQNLQARNQPQQIHHLIHQNSGVPPPMSQPQYFSTQAAPPTHHQQQQMTQGVAPQPQPIPGHPVFGQTVHHAQQQQQQPPPPQPQPQPQQQQSSHQTIHNLQKTSSISTPSGYAQQYQKPNMGYYYGTNSPNQIPHPLQKHQVAPPPIHARQQHQQQPPPPIPQQQQMAQHLPGYTYGPSGYVPMGVHLQSQIAPPQPLSHPHQFPPPSSNWR